MVVLNEIELFDYIVFALNVLGASYAAWWNFKAFNITPYPHKKLRIITGILALVYILGYLAVMTGLVPVPIWSSIFRGVSLVVWPLIWALPAKMAIRTWTHVNEGVSRLFLQSRESEIETSESEW